MHASVAPARYSPFSQAPARPLLDASSLQPSPHFPFAGAVEPETAVQTTASNEERREWPRVKLEVSARIRFPTTEAAIMSRTFDISRGGVFLQVPDPKPVGTGVRLVVEVGERTMVVAGIVARVSDGYNGLPGMGVRFTEISADDEEFLAELVDARRAREPALAMHRSTSRH